MVQNNYIGVGATGLSLINTKNPVMIATSSGNTVKSNCLCYNGYYHPIQVSNSGGTTQQSNDLYANVAAGLRVV